MKGFGRGIDAFDDFSVTAKKLLTDPRWPSAFKVSDEDQKRYGNTGPGLACALARNVLREDGGTRYIHICQHGWDHHSCIWDRTKSDNHYKLMAEFDPALASLIEDLAVTPSKATPGKMLLDETLVVFMSEFGRTPGKLNHMDGRDHHKYAFPAMFAGAGAKGGLVLGASDKDGDKVVDTGWSHKAAAAHRKRGRHDVLGSRHRLVQVGSQYAISVARTFTSTRSARTDIIPTDELSAIYG